MRQRGIDLNQGLELAVVNQFHLFDLHDGRATTALERKPLTRMIDQDLTHDTHRTRHQMAAITRSTVCAGQPQVALVHQRRGIQGELTTPKRSSGETLQIGIDQINESIPRHAIAGLGLGE